MNKRIKQTVIFSCALFLLASCGKGDPRKNGTAAGKAACQCYKLENAEAVNKCLSDIEKKYQDFLTDTAYINASEEQLLKCITDGVIDIANPIKEAPDSPQKETVDNKQKDDNQEKDNNKQ